MFNFREIRALAERAGFPDQELDTAAAVGMAESGGDPLANGPSDPERKLDSNGRYSVGLFQINLTEGAKPGTGRQTGGVTVRESELEIPIVNALTANSIRKQQGWKAWGAYTNGSYKDYLPKGDRLTAEDLKRIGFLGRKTDVERFQEGFAFWALAIDGIFGLKTEEALAFSIAADGACGGYFKYREFKSKGNGDIRVNRALVYELDRIREAHGGPITIVSGYRDPSHNRKVDGAAESQHLYGTGADLEPHIPDRLLHGRKISGKGYSRPGVVLHVDVRHAGPNNTTGGTPQKPTTWNYF